MTTVARGRGWHWVIGAVIATLATPGALASQSVCCLTEGLAIAGQYRVAGLEDRRFDHDTQTGYDPLDPQIKIGHRDGLFPSTHRQQSGFVDQVGEIGARETGRDLRHPIQIHIRSHGDGLAMNLEYL